MCQQAQILRQTHILLNLHFNITFYLLLDVNSSFFINLKLKNVPLFIKNTFPIFTKLLLF